MVEATKNVVNYYELSYRLWNRATSVPDIIGKEGVKYLEQGLHSLRIIL